jgi:TM2 domain-containing membrane protein YozV
VKSSSRQMRLLKITAFTFFLIIANANNFFCFGSQAYIVIQNDSALQFTLFDSELRPNPILSTFRVKQKKNKKITAALLAFPFPFGIVGLHRIYLGTAPHVPVVYIGTLGGALGILPFIDFCVLMLDKDIETYIENKNVLMWVQENNNSGK